jgi:hypothetical protein
VGSLVGGAEVVDRSGESGGEGRWRGEVVDRGGGCGEMRLSQVWEEIGRPVCAGQGENLVS